MKLTETSGHCHSDAQPFNAQHMLLSLRRSSTQEDRRIVRYLWHCSGQPGGLQAVADALVEMFPERVQSQTMAAQPNPPGGKYDIETALAIEEEVTGKASWEKDTYWRSWEHYRNRSLFDGEWHSEAEDHAEWLRMTVPRIDEEKRSRTYWLDKCQDVAKEHLADRLRSIGDSEYEVRSNYWHQDWFQDLHGALVQYQRRASEIVMDAHYQTNIGRVIWATLDTFLEDRQPCLVSGNPRRGKTTNLRKWCAANAGEAVYLEAPAYGTQNDFFHKLAGALGIPASSSKAANEIRFRLEDVLRRSGLALVIDEAQRLLLHKGRDNSPSLINWIDSLTDMGVPVALCATPQFGHTLAKIAHDTGWALEQFIGRFAGQCVQLPEDTSRKDMEQLAAKLLPGSESEACAKAADCAIELGRDVSGLANLVEAARKQANESGRQEVTLQDLVSGGKARVPHEMAIERIFSAPRRRGRGQPSAMPEPTAIAQAAPDVATETAAAGAASRGSTFSTPTAALPGRGRQTSLAAHKPLVARLDASQAPGADASAAGSGHRIVTLPVTPSQPSRAGSGAVNRSLNSPLLDRRVDSENEPDALLEPTVVA